MLQSQCRFLGHDVVGKVHPELEPIDMKANASCIWLLNFSLL